MPPRVGSSTVDAGPVRSAIISRSSERRSKRCIAVSSRSPVFRCLANERTLHSRSRTFKREFDYDGARGSTAPEHEKILARQEAALAHQSEPGAPSVAHERFRRNAPLEGR